MLDLVDPQSDWADRFPAIVDAALRLKAQSFLIDGEVVIVRDDGTPDFRRWCPRCEIPIRAVGTDAAADRVSMRNRGDRPRGQSCDRSREENLAMVMMLMAVTRDRARLISIAALAAATGMFAEAAEATTLAAWVQLVGRDGAASIRAMTDGATCPSLSVDGTAVRMRVRAEPGPLFADASSLPHADFPIRVCEAAAEPKTKVVLDGKDLPVPRGDIRRIVVFATPVAGSRKRGCRIATMPTNGPTRPWPSMPRRQSRMSSSMSATISTARRRARRRSSTARNSPTGYGWNTCRIARGYVEDVG